MRRLLILTMLGCGSPMMNQPCNVDTCHNGCCRNGQCETGTSNLSCGRYGLGCADCVAQGMTCNSSQSCSGATGGGSGGGSGGAGGGNVDGGFQIIAEIYYLESNACTDNPEECLAEKPMQSSRFNSLRTSYAGCQISTPTTNRWTIDCRAAVTCGSSAIDCAGDAGRQWNCPSMAYTLNDGCAWTPP